MLAKIKIVFLFGAALLWGFLVPFVPGGASSQIWMAFGLTIILFVDVGRESAVYFIRSMSITLLSYWVIVFLLYWEGWAESWMFLIPLYFYSAMVGINTIIRRVGLRDLLNALSPGKVRTALVIVKVLFDTAGSRMQRIAWYASMLTAHHRWALSRRAARALVTILATCLWLFRDVPVKRAIAQNRERHLGG